jgi:hypothetical protein
VTKKPRPDAGPMSLKGWSIGSSNLTSHGQNELLKRLGAQMEDDYAQVLGEPLPDPLQVLLNKLDQRGSRPDEQDP